MNRRTLILVTLLLAASPAFAQEQLKVTLPGTPAGRLFNKYFEVMNSGDLAAMRAFFKEHQPKIAPDDAVSQQIQIHNVTGKLEVVSVDPRSTDTAIVVKARSLFTGNDSQHFITLEPGSTDKIRASGMASAGYDMSQVFAPPKP